MKEVFLPLGAGVWTIAGNAGNGAGVMWKWTERRTRWGRRGPLVWELTLRSKHPVSGARLTIRQCVSMREVRSATIDILRLRRQDMQRAMLEAEGRPA